jgi:hypothetical protein
MERLNVPGRIIRRLRVAFAFAQSGRQIVNILDLALVFSQRIDLDIDVVRNVNLLVRPGRSRDV